MRSLGYKVVYQPPSRLIHHEGVTLGNERQHRLQAFPGHQSREVLREVARRSGARALRAAPATRGARGRPPARPGALVFDDRMPTPDRDAGSARMSFILKAPRPLEPPRLRLRPSKREWPEYEKPLWQEGVETASAVELRRLLKERKFQRRRRQPPSGGRGADPVDPPPRPADKDRLRHGGRAFHPLRARGRTDGRRATAREAARYRKIETRLARASDLILCTSTADKEVMGRTAPGVRIEVIPTIHELQERGLPFAEREHLLFVGNLAHRPNSDGVQYFMREIYPLVRQALPEIELDIIGDNPAETCGLRGGGRARARLRAGRGAVLADAARLRRADPLRRGRQGQDRRGAGVRAARRHDAGRRGRHGTRRRRVGDDRGDALKTSPTRSFNFTAPGAMAASRRQRLRTHRAPFHAREHRARHRGFDERTARKQMVAAVLVRGPT